MNDTGGTATVDTRIAIQLTDIVKRFPGVVANDGVNLTVREGTVHAIVGENGAGKSTLMKTLYGAHQPNEGTITVEGTDVHFSSPKDAIAAGIGMVFQAFLLAANLTVWENIVLGQEPGSALSLDAKQARQRIRDLAHDLDLLLLRCPRRIHAHIQRSDQRPLGAEGDIDIRTHPLRLQHLDQRRWRGQVPQILHHLNPSLF